MLIVTYLRLSDVSVICRVTYFHFLIQSAFLSYIGRQAAPTLQRTNTHYRTSDVAEDFDMQGPPFLCETYSPGERL